MIGSLPLAAIPAEDEALRLPVREFARAYAAAVAPELRARSWMGFDAAFSRQLAERGWLGLTLPSEYGGKDRGHLARFVVVEELLAVGAPMSAHWIADRQSGPLIAKYGTDAQKRFYLPRICSAEAFFCIGMSEPNAGSDLASVGTRARKTDAGWRLDGRKIWTTNAPRSHYMIALVRTSAHRRIGTRDSPSSSSPVASRGDDPPGGGPCRRLAFLGSLLRRCGARGGRADRCEGAGWNKSPPN